MEFDERIISTRQLEGDNDLEHNIRPKNMDEYIGQEKVKDGLRIYIDAALQRKEALLLMQQLVASSQTDCLVNQISLYKAVAGNL